MNPTFDKAKFIFYISAVSAAVLYVFSSFGKTLGAIVLPFAIARVCAEFLSRPAQYLSAKTYVPKAVWCIAVVVSFYSAFFVILYRISGRLFSELKGLLQHATIVSKNLPIYAEKARIFVSEHIPFFDFSEKTELLIEKMSLGAVSEITTGITSQFANGIPQAISAVPQFLIFVLITILATCYFTIDLKKTNDFILCQLKEPWKNLLKEIKAIFFETVTKYIGAYIVICAITFAELFFGFFFICRKYAFVLALGVAILDILPLFGTGMVIIPWAFYEFFAGDKISCLKLIILYLVITVVRQITEPKILGSVMGIHPLITLFSIYAGAKLMGFSGVFIFPVITIIIKNLNDRKTINLYRNMPQTAEDKLHSARKKYRRFIKKGK